MRTRDPEVRAARALVRALTPLDKPQQRRLLRWAIERFTSPTSAPSRATDVHRVSREERGTAAAAED